MKFITTLVALTAFVAAHEGAHDAQGNHLDAQGNIITFKNGTKPPYPIPPTQGGNNSSGNQNKQYPLPSNQGGNNSNGNQGGNQGQKPYPIPNNQSGGGNQPSKEEFEKFLQSPLIQKFMQFLKQNAHKY